jgi:hypothetical protein
VGERRRKPGLTPPPATKLLGFVFEHAVCYAVMKLLLKILTVLCIPPGSGFQSFPVTTLGSLPTLRIELDEVVFKFWPHIDVVRDVKE